MRIAVFFVVVSIMGAGVVSAWMISTRGANEGSNPETQGVAVAIAEEDEFEFGVMDLHATNFHQFRVTNQGDGVLTLSKGRVSCSCTKSEILKTELQPGESTEVVVAWETEEWSDGFYQYAKVLTNDPLRPELKFTIFGKVMSNITADDDELRFGMIDPEIHPEAEFVIYSQHWDDLTIDSVTSSWDGAEWSLEPAPKDILLDRNALSGFVVNFTGPQVPAATKVREWLRFQGSRESDPSAEANFEIEITGKTRRNISIYGDAISSNGVFEFGVIPRGEEFHRRFYIKVRGEHRDINFEEINAQPDFVKVNVTRYQVGDAEGLFHLDVTIPADAPISYHRKENMGRIDLISDHPEEPEISLDIDFQIYEP